MALFDKIYKAKYSAKNYKKYCKDANSTFVYTSVYLSYNENLDDLPKFVQNVHYITLFLADTLNSSLFLFFYDEEHYKFKDKIKEALIDAKMDEVLSIYLLALETFSNVTINRNVNINEFKKSVPNNVQYNANFYEEELVKLQQNDYLYNQLNNYFIEELEKTNKK